MKHKSPCAHKTLRSRCSTYRQLRGIFCDGCCQKCGDLDCEAFFDCERVGEKGAVDMTKIKGEAQ